MAVVNAEAARQLMALNDAAAADWPRLGRQVGADLDALLNGELEHASATQIERQGRERLVTLALDATQSWRTRPRQLIQEGLPRVDAGLTAELKTALDVPGRHRVREHRRREAPGLVDAQIGRARADRQYRLAEASRGLVLVVQRRYADARGRMQAALQAAEELRTSSAAAEEDENRELSERTGVAVHVLTLLDEAAGTSG